MHQQESVDLLLERAVKRDKAAFAALYDNYVDQVYRHVYYHVSNQIDAENITQEAFIKAWKAIDRYKRTGAPFVAWLMAIARNLIAEHYKSRRNFMSLEEAEANSNSAETNPEAMIEASLKRSYVRKAILKLKGEKQKVVLMHFIDGFTYSEIAKALNKSEGAVRVIQYRAINDLRRMLMRSE